MNVDYNHAMLSSHNEVKMFADGNEKFTALIEDIMQAKESIHIQYYIFKLDDVGNRVFNALVQKAKEGVEVKLIYDDLGSRKLRPHHLRLLTGQVDKPWRSFHPFSKYLIPVSISVTTENWLLSMAK